MFFAKRVPPVARDAYNKDAMAGMLSAAMGGITLPFIIVIARKTLHASPMEVGILTMAPAAGYLLSLPWANVTLGRSKMPFAIYPWLIARALFFLTIFATTSNIFVGIYVLFCIFAAIAVPPYTDIMKEIYPDSDRGKIMGFVRVLTSVCSIIFVLIAGVVLKYVSYRYVFPVAAIFGIWSTLVFKKINVPQVAAETGVKLFRFLWDSVVVLFNDKGYLWFCSGIFLYGLATYFAAPVFALYEVDILNVATVRQSVYTFVVSICSMIGYFHWGTRLDRRRPEKIVAAQSLAWALIPVIYLLSTKWWMLVPAKILLGIVGSGNDLAYFMGVIYFAPRERLSQYQAIFLTLIGIRGIIGPLSAGWLVERNILGSSSVFIICAVATVVSVGVLMFGYKRYRPIHENHGETRAD